MVFLGTLNDQLDICEYTRSGQLIGPTGCYNLTPAFQWIDHCIISIFLVFMIAFLPLFLQGERPRSLAVVTVLIRLVQNSSSVVLARLSSVSRSTSAPSPRPLRCFQPRFRRTLSSRT